MDFDAAPFLPLYRRLANQDGQPGLRRRGRAGWRTFPLHEPAKLLALPRLDPWLRAALPESCAAAAAGRHCPPPRSGGRRTGNLRRLPVPEPGAQ